jgi:hypothetical protein
MEGTSCQRRSLALRGAILFPRFSNVFDRSRRVALDAVLTDRARAVHGRRNREGNLFDTRWVRSPAKGGECPCLEGNFEGQGPRGNHLQRDCRRDGRVSSIALPSKARLQETWRSGIGSSAIVVRGSSGVSTPGVPRGRRRKVSSVGAFSSCVDAAKAPLTRERASRRHRRPRPSTYILSGAISKGHGTDGAARTSRFWLPPRASSRVGRGLEGSCCLVLAAGRFDDRSDRVSLFDSTARS